MFTINACEFGASFLVCIHHINQKLAHKQLPAVSKKVLLNCFHLIRALINLSHLLEFVLNSSVLWILNPVSSQTLIEFLMCPFFYHTFFCLASTETVLFLHQTPLKLHVFTSEVSRTQNPARCRSWPFFISLWILGNNHALITRPALARAPWQWASCTRKHQRCNSRSSLSRQRTLKISLELPGAHSLGLFFAIKFHYKNICKTRIPSAVRATHCGKLHVWRGRTRRGGKLP